MNGVATTSAHDQPDPRWSNFKGPVVGTGDHLYRRPITHEDLAEVIARLDGIAPGAPPAIAEMLRVARALIVQSWWCYDFLTVSVVWSLMAVEAALRERLVKPEEPSPTFKPLVRLAKLGGLLGEEDGKTLEAGAKLRDGLVHARGQVALTLGIAVPLVKISHELINRLYDADPERPERR